MRHLSFARLLFAPFPSLSSFLWSLRAPLPLSLQGYYCPLNTSTPIACGLGHFAPTVGYHECAPCPIGYFQDGRPSGERMGDSSMLLLPSTSLLQPLATPCRLLTVHPVSPLSQASLVTVATRAGPTATASAKDSPTALHASRGSTAHSAPPRSLATRASTVISSRASVSTRH